MIINLRRMAFYVRSAAVTGALALSACGEPEKTAEAAPEAAVQKVGAENVAVAVVHTLRSGPAISGELSAAREARIRAEVAGSVLQTLVDAGQAVAEGTILARIDNAVLMEAAQSARSGVTQATVGAEQAARELKRATTLLAAGAIAERDLESAERANVTAQAQLAEAKSRVSAVEKSVGNAIVRAPFAGVVAERSVSAGDVVAPGSPLFTIVDPQSLQLQASVPTTALGDVRVGAPVLFTVNGSDRQLEGRITRVNPMVDPLTKQITLLATVPNQRGTLVAGLFVQGRITTEKRTAIMVPEKAVDQQSVVAFVIRLKGGKVERVEVGVGVRDEAAETLEIRSGLAAGDTVLLGAARSITVGSSVAVWSPKDAPESPVKNN